VNREDRGSRDVVLSVVLPVFNESQILQKLTQELESALSNSGVQLEIVFVNDGSRDDSARILDELAHQKPFVKVLHFSRNFGHQSALQAGLTYGSGDVFVVMDSDMQDLPTAIPTLLEKWREGYDIVYAVRKNRKENPLKVFLFHSFYRVLNRLSAVYIPNDAGNFGVVDGTVARKIAGLAESDRFYPGLRSWIGYRQIGVEVERGARYDGNPRVSLFRLFSLAKTAIFSFSTLPLLMFYALSAISLLIFLGFTCFALYHKFYTGLAIPGWTSQIMVACLFGSLNSLGIAVLGEYIARIYAQVRARPSFIVERAVNIPPDVRT
jgi:glycosyltransferase involved in cell wall biosynthesis